MKKHLFLQCVLTALLPLSLTSCSDDEPNSNPEEKPNVVSNGAYILNQGQYSLDIEGNLNYMDYTTGKMENDLFRKANNNQSIGNTPQCGVRYGSKIYIGVYGSNTIWVLDAKTCASLKQISLDASTTGTEPRAMSVDKGKVYISMFDGYIARLDTTSLEFDGRVKVGPNPEKTAIVGRNLYVPNSDGMNWQVGYGTTASIIDLDSFTVTDTVDVPLNPETFITAGGKLYLLAKGNYGDVESALYEVDPAIASIQKKGTGQTGYRQVANATLVAAGDEDIFYIDAPYDAPEMKYGVLSSSSGAITEWTPKEVVYPNAIAVDPVHGYILISSYIMDGIYPSYIAPGFLVRYDKNFSFLDKSEIGSGPACIFFNH